MRLRSRVVIAACVLLFAASASEGASTWYVKADASAGGDGSRNRPFATLQEVEHASKAGDTIRVVPSSRALDEGIQLKDGQRLIGLGDPVTRPAAGAQPTVSNTSAAR
jgi:hypothetical protein